MTVPDFQSIMLPLLKVAGDKKEHTISETMDFLAREVFHLTEEDRKEKLPSGVQNRFDNRVGWARTYLIKAGLLVVTGRGKFCITERGLSVLKNSPAAINTKFLMQYPEFKELITGSRKSSRSDSTEEIEIQTGSQTPEELLGLSYSTLREQLATDILERVKKCAPSFFEQLVVDLVVAMGYGGSRKDPGEAVGQSGDGGIDGIIKEDRLGLDVVYIQAKRWEKTVGRPDIQAFVGSIDGLHAKKGVFISTSQFSNEAKEYVTKTEKKIVLIDGEQLAQFMIDYNIGVATVSTYVVKKIDLDYFEE
jgi:restriction system protein